MRARFLRLSTRVASSDKHPITLAIDVGGSGVKSMLLDCNGQPLSDRRRVNTPRPATPPRVIGAIEQLMGRQRDFDRVAVGFPGWIEHGVVRTAYNLHPNWVGYDLEARMRRLTGRAVRVMNDAEVQGLAHISGRGLEMIITFGTGVGSAVFVDGKVVPGLEIGQQRAKNGKTYDELLNRKALDKVGAEHWRKRVSNMVDEIEPVWNYRRLYLGGGNSKHLRQRKLPENVELVSNEGGLWGGHELWENPEAIEWAEVRSEPAAAPA